MQAAAGTNPMDCHGLRRLDGLIWIVIALVAAAVLGAASIFGFSIAYRSFNAPVVVCMVLAGGAWFYRRRRDEPKLASALETTGQLMAFSAVGAPLSYLAATAGFPTQDRLFDGMDRALSLDWLGLLAIMKRWPELSALLHLAYLSLTVQTAVVVLLLAFTGRLAWLRVYMLAFVIAALTTIAISAMLPAEGVWLHYGLSPNAGPLPDSHTSWPVFLGLRDGSYRTFVAAGAEGIITFPSLHAALAVILMAACWPVPVARWVGMVLDTLMLIATPIEGSHYFVDVFAGIAIAIGSLMLAREIVRRLNAPMPVVIEPALVPGR
jgi:hypothetical protein